MKKHLWQGGFTLLACAVCLLCAAGTAHGDVVLYDNGPLITDWGVCPGGADASRLQTDLGMSTYGFGSQLVSGNRVAEDFTAAGDWHISSITFLAYQTASSLASTMSGVYVRIWNGVPDVPGSSVIFGDLASNRFATTSFANVYRVNYTNFTGITRPIMRVVATIDTIVDPGTYWVEWTLDGTLASGPWSPPITISGQTNTGNALQYTASAGAWAAARDTSILAPQGLPFVVSGSVVPEPLLGTAALLAVLVARRAFRP